ncbi:MAG: nucleotidyltransferase substrate binding protein [Mycoplasmataceae bacterium RC_NB112A]|nr:MAG: nucleotidyltransferase substrate binding protein [Mycoplasmataceae bacterium RC_NB112A]KLL01910.1 MAG: nucleotidyltransferase substrate binding protein [Mycoplasmataceae bacterium RC_NB112A]
MTKEKIDLQPLFWMKTLLENSLTRLEEEKLDELGQMGAIQAFEVSYELVWKTLQKFLAWEGRETRSPRETFRLAAQFGYLDNPQIWFNLVRREI